MGWVRGLRLICPLLIVRKFEGITIEDEDNLTERVSGYGLSH